MSPEAHKHEAKVNPILSSKEIAKTSFDLIENTRQRVVERSGLNSLFVNNEFSICHSDRLSEQKGRYGNIRFSLEEADYELVPTGYEERGITSKGIIMIRIRDRERTIIRLDSIYKVKTGENIQFIEGEAIVDKNPLKSAVDFDRVPGLFPELLS